MNRHIIIVLTAVVAVAAASPAAERLLFRSGFEHDTRLVDESSSYVDIAGTDRSVRPPNDWAKDFGKGSLGRFRFQYAGGDKSQRQVTIETDPADKANRVLRYWMKHVNVSPNASYGGKGRIQANVAGNPDLREFYYRVRVRFASDWRHLRDWDQPMGWFILAEFWNNANWTREGHPFRIHITIGNDSGSKKGLFFGVGAQIEDKRWKSIWHERNTEFAIPIDQWLTAEIYLKEGKGDSGRFYFAITGPDGRKTVLFDVHNTTCHPDDPNPDGFKQFNPMKLYTHNKNIHRVRGQSGALVIYWDDFELWTGRKP